MTPAVTCNRKLTRLTAELTSGEDKAIETLESVWGALFYSINLALLYYLLSVHVQLLLSSQHAVFQLESDTFLHVRQSLKSRVWIRPALPAQIRDTKSFVGVQLLITQLGLRTSNTGVSEGLVMDKSRWLSWHMVQANGGHVWAPGICMEFITIRMKLLFNKLA